MQTAEARVELNPFQLSCLAALRDLADRRDVPLHEVGRNSYDSDLGVEIDVGWVPLEVAGDQVSICTPYNGRTFELGAYSAEDVLLRDLTETVGAFLDDPTAGRHPLARMVARLLRVVRGSAEQPSANGPD
jgi:hypothetical protein